MGGTADATGRAEEPPPWVGFMSFGGFLGLGKSCHPLPWHVLTYDPGRGGYVIDLDKESDSARRPASARATARTGTTVRGPAASMPTTPTGRTGHATKRRSMMRSTTASRPATRPPGRVARPALGRRNGPDGDRLAGGGLRDTGSKSREAVVSTNPSPDPTPSDRKKLIGVGVLLAVLVVLLLLALYGLGLWSSGEMPSP